VINAVKRNYLISTASRSQISHDRARHACKWQAW